MAYAASDQSAVVPSSSSSPWTVTLVRAGLGRMSSMVTCPPPAEPGKISPPVPRTVFPAGQVAVTLLLDEFEGLLAKTCSSPAGGVAQMA